MKLNSSFLKLLLAIGVLVPCMIVAMSSYIL